MKMSIFRHSGHFQTQWPFLDTVAIFEVGQGCWIYNEKVDITSEWVKAVDFAVYQPFFSTMLCTITGRLKF